MTKTKNNWRRGFVSYSCSKGEIDHEFISAVVKELKIGIDANSPGKPFSFFYDLESIREGDNWMNLVEQQIELCGIFLPIITHGYFSSDYCEYEFDMFIKKNRKYAFDNSIFPIYLQTCDQIERHDGYSGSTWVQTLAQVHYTDLRNFDPTDLLNTYNPALLHLANTLNIRADEMALTNGGTRWRKTQEYTCLPKPESPEYADLVDVKFLKLNKTQMHIVRQLYRMGDDEIAINDLLRYINDRQPERIGNVKELLYRLKDIQHDGLLELVPFGANTTLVKRVEGVNNVLHDRSRLIT